MADEEYLPEEIVIDEVKRRGYMYQDLFLMLDDIQRLRKKTGWVVAADVVGKYITFRVGQGELPVLDLVLFHFELSGLRSVNWPRSYLGIQGIKNAFTRATERNALVKAINDIPKDIEPGEPRSIWVRLFDDNI